MIYYFTLLAFGEVQGNCLLIDIDLDWVSWWWLACPRIFLWSKLKLLLLFILRLFLQKFIHCTFPLFLLSHNILHYIQLGFPCCPL